MITHTKTTTDTKIDTATKINTGATPAQEPNNTDQPAMISISVGSATLLLDVLDACDEFFRTAPRSVRVELAEFCRFRPGISSGSLIDAVGLHALHVRARLTDHTTAQQATAAPQDDR